MDTQHRLAVLGSPISHSRSPQIHRAAYEVLGLEWEYEQIELVESQIKEFLLERGTEWLGFSVTMPLKVEARKLSMVLDPVAQESGVVNTLLRLVDHQGKPSWAGFNTDVPGLAAAIEHSGLDASHTIVFGAGATAVSAVLAARQLGASRVSIVARRLEAANELVEKLEGANDGLILDAHTFEALPTDLLQSASLIISTLPGSAAAELKLPAACAEVPLFDVAYDPWPSPLAGRWDAWGGRSYSGLAMLVNQALIQVRIFLNGDPALPLENEPEVLAAMQRAVSQK